MTTEPQPDIDAASRAAGDDTNAATAPQEAPAFTDQQVACVSALVIGALTGDRTAMEDDELFALDGLRNYGKDLIVHALGKLHQADAVAYLPPLVQIAEKGWRLALEMIGRTAEERVGKLQDELTAHKAHAAKEQLLLSTIRAREAQVEATKGALNTAKKRLEEAHEDLAAHCAGGVQTKHPDLQPKPAPNLEQTAREKGRSAYDQGQALSANTYQEGTPERDEWCVGWRLQRMAKREPVPGHKLGLTADAMEEVRLLSGELGVSEKAPSVADKTVDAFDRAHLVIDAVCLGNDEDADAPRRFLLLPIYTKDEWQQIHEAKFGRAVEGFDQGDEAKAKRIQGGPDCGRVVTMGKKRGVIAPLSDAVVIETGDAAEDLFADNGQGEDSDKEDDDE